MKYVITSSASVYSSDLSKTQITGVCVNDAARANLERIRRFKRAN